MRRGELVGEKIWSRVLYPTNFEIWRQSQRQVSDLVWSLIWGQVSAQTRTAVEHELWDQLRIKDATDEQQAEE